MEASSSARPTRESKLPGPWSVSSQRTLLTRTASSNRHRFPYPSAAKAFFKIIKRADESGYIEQVCAFFDSVLVRTIRLSHSRKMSWPVCPRILRLLQRSVTWRTGVMRLKRWKDREGEVKHAVEREEGKRGLPFALGLAQEQNGGVFSRPTVLPPR
jgi:hypothetical protein